MGPTHHTSRALLPCENHPPTPLASLAGSPSPSKVGGTRENHPYPQQAGGQEFTTDGIDELLRGFMAGIPEWGRFDPDPTQ
jgi:hypothetical protein